MQQVWLIWDYGETLLAICTSEEKAFEMKARFESELPRIRVCIQVGQLDVKLW
jgi:hypothetical protein